jgi:ATP-dependent DNA helicase RecG
VHVSELLRLLTQPESSGLEFKRDDLSVQDLAREVVALANLEGGTILLGVEDDGTVSGTVRDDLEAWVMNACRDKVTPEINPYFETHRDVEPGRDVAVVGVTRGYTVHSVWHQSRRSYYIRVGSTCREASPDELERLFQQRRGLRAELQPVSGTDLADLDRVRLDDYFRRVRDQDVPAQEDDDGWAQLLVATEFMTDSVHGPVVTLAGMVLFGLRLDRFLPHAGIDATAFPGHDKDYGTLDRQELAEPMTALGPASQPTQSGVVEATMAFVRRNTTVTGELAGGVQRVERVAYPEGPVREAVVNALVHRDYLLSGTRIELSVYADRLEVVSPGRLPNDITPKAMRLGTRSARNQMIKDVMRDYGYLEHLGMGVSRKIIRGMREHNGTEPDLIEDDERLLVRLWGHDPVTG